MKIFYIVLLAFVLQFSFSANAEATGLSAPVELGGYAWAGNDTNPSASIVDLAGVGWISMSCSNTDTCVGGSAPGPKVDYGVQIETDGSMTGYAWSSNIGWIRFGGLSGFPAGAGTSAQNAATTGTYPNLIARGWVRACSVYAAGCSGALKSDSERGGWDGWISLGGTGYGVTTDAGGGTTNSFAWGSDVVGWVNFDQVLFGAVAPSVAINTFTASPSAVSVGSGSVLRYNVTGATSCTASNNNGDTTWTSSLVLDVTPGDKDVLVTPPAGATTYTLSCTDGVTAPVTQTVSVTATVPSVAISSFSVSPSSLALGNTANLSYNVTGATSCTASNDRSETDWTSSRSIGNANGANGPYTVTPTYLGVITYTLSCTDGSTTVNRTAAVSTTPAAPTVTLGGSSVVRSGQSATVTWNIASAGAFSCSLSGPGMPATPITSAGTGSAPSDVLYSTTVFEMDCGGGNTFTYQVQVIPTFQEF